MPEIKDVVFFGSSDFSLSALKACLDYHRVVHVITTPDRPKGRGLQLLPTPVRAFCIENKIPVTAPPTLKNSDLMESIRRLKPFLFVVSSYGKMIPSPWLGVPSRLNLNVHPSLLPKYRGAAPVNWPILNGDGETGLSIAEVTDKLDAGGIFYQKKIDLPSNMDSGELEEILAELSFEALRTVFDQIDKGVEQRTVQIDTESTYARKLAKDDGIIQWNSDAKTIANQVRGLLPWPLAVASFDKVMMQILKATDDSDNPSGVPGEILAVDKKRNALRVKTLKGCLEIYQIKPAGKNVMDAVSFANGWRVQPGMKFETVLPADKP